MLLIENNGTLKSIKHSELTVDPYYELVLKGQIKGNLIGGAAVSTPIIGMTGKSGINNAIWIKRLGEAKSKLGISGGQLFSRHKISLFRKTRLPLLKDFEKDFLEMLENVQAIGKIEEDVDVRDEYGIKRSLRRSV